MLAQFSTVFSSMFRSEFKEAKEGVVKICIVSHSLLLKFVRFLYGYQLEVHGTDVIEIMLLSDMYDITPLRHVCYEFLHKHLMLTNAMTLWSYCVTV